MGSDKMAPFLLKKTIFQYRNLPSDIGILPLLISFMGVLAL